MNGCPPKCPGCRYIDLPYNETLNKKFDFIQNHFKKWHNKIQSIRFSEKNILNYRKKVILNVKYNQNSWIFGMVLKNDVIDISDCPIHNEIVKNSILLLKEILPSYKLFPLHFYLQYDKQIALIVKTKENINTEWIETYSNEFNKMGIEGIWLHKNPSAGKRIFEKTPLELVYGKHVSINENNIYYSIGAFQQLIPELYNEALTETKQFFGNENYILDLYSGSGTSLKIWSSFTNTLGVELNGMSFKIALLNAPSALILRGKCSERLPQIESWINENKKNQINLFVNPPRIGIEKEVIDWIVKDRIPEKIAYLSCSPGTLLRDLEKISSLYEVIKIIPYDFFPYTHHIENLVLLRKL